MQNLLQEFDRQVENLLQKGYPEAAGLSVGEFLQHVAPLRERAGQLTVPEADLEQGRLPFAIVIRSGCVPTETAMRLAERGGRPGITKLYPCQPDDFRPIDDVSIPTSLAYLLADLDRGKASLNLPPSAAMPLIRVAARSPLTIDEGVAIITHYPEFLMKNNCFSLLASRYDGDKRVPAIWINAEKKANLGWCWDGNPHTWLGSASCHSRIGV